MINQIQTIIAQLHQNKKMITFGMVKAKAGNTIPLPFITREISSYKQDPDAYFSSVKHLLNVPLPTEDDSKKTKQSTNNTSLEERVKTLEQQVAILTKQLNERIKVQ